MRAKCQLEIAEGRALDSFDMFMVLDLLKEYDWKTIWERYSPVGQQSGKINFNLSTDSYFAELTLESLTGLALSGKYQASPALIQFLIGRVLCGHRHGLIVQRLKRHGFPVEDESQFNLSGSVGTIGVDLVVNHLANAPEYQFKKFGTSRVEQEEQRPLDYFDMVRIIGLAPRRTGQILEGYVPQELLNEGHEEEQKVAFTCPVGDYSISLMFQRISNKIPHQIPERGNVSAIALQQTVRRVMAGHAPELVARVLNERGIILTAEEAAKDFTLARIVNDNRIELHFKR